MTQSVLLNLVQFSKIRQRCSLVAEFKLVFFKQEFLSKEIILMDDYVSRHSATQPAQPVNIIHQSYNAKLEVGGGL